MQVMVAYLVHDGTEATHCFSEVLFVLGVSAVPIEHRCAILQHEGIFTSLDRLNGHLCSQK
jgi:hypothetical protein